MARYTPLSIAVDNARDFLDKLYEKEIQHEDGGFPLYMRAEDAQTRLERARSDITEERAHLAVSRHAYWDSRTGQIAKANLLAECDAITADLITSIRHTTRARERARSVTSARRAQIRSQK